MSSRVLAIADKIVQNERTYENMCKAFDLSWRLIRENLEKNVCNDFFPENNSILDDFLLYELDYSSLIYDLLLGTKDCITAQNILEIAEGDTKLPDRKNVTPAFKEFLSNTFMQVLYEDFLLKR